MRRSTVPAVLGLCLCAGGGCAPAAFVDGVAWTVRREGVANAAFQRVRGYPSLRLNARLLDRLDAIQAAGDLPRARAELTEILDEAHRLEQYAAGSEIDRLSARTLERLHRRYFQDEPPSGALRERLRARYRRQADARHTELAVLVQSAASVEELRVLARRLRAAVGPSPKDHHGGGPLLALVAASIKEDRGPLDHGGPLIDLYLPPDRLTCGCPERSAAAGAEDGLLRAFAPIIVQERNDDATYDSATDRIGTVQLHGWGDGPAVAIDTARPSVYAYWQYAWISGRAHLQLTYTHWFPAHPALKPLDAEAGRVEGATLRITLDSAGRPGIMETVLNCGCYHRCYPAAWIEAAACDVHGGPSADKRFCIERAVAGKMDWIVPAVIDVRAGDLTRPILFSRAGYHGLAGVSFQQHELDARTVREQRTYTLRCYDELERLPVGSGFGSMFDTDGLVKGARRLEGVLLAPTGMLSAGQPRQRGTQLLHWDQYDFDDPHLLEVCLRLPPEF